MIKKIFIVWLITLSISIYSMEKPIGGNLLKSQPCPKEANNLENVQNQNIENQSQNLSDRIIVAEILETFDNYEVPVTQTSLALLDKSVSEESKEVANYHVVLVSDDQEKQDIDSDELEEEDPEYFIREATDEEIARALDSSINANNSDETCNVYPGRLRKRRANNIRSSRPLKRPLKKSCQTKKSNGKHECKECGKEYKHIGDLRRHIQGIHGDGFECNICHRNVGTYGQLRLHRKKFHKKS